MGKKSYDWEQIKEQYRTGTASIRAIAREHGCSDGAIRKRIKKEGWKKDLADKVRKEVREQLVREQVLSKPGEQRTANQVRDEEIVEEAARKGADVVRYHRKVIQIGHKVVENLLIDLHTAIGTREALQEEIEDQTAEDSNPKRRIELLKAVDLPKQATTALQLSNALQNLIRSERQAYGLDEGNEGDSEPTMYYHDPKHPERHG